MPRFTNEWLIDASLYSHFKGVPCCGPAATPPETVSDTIAALVHLCDDVPATEIMQESLVSPFPDDIKDDVWRARVLFRRVVLRACTQFNETSATTKTLLAQRIHHYLAQQGTANIVTLRLHRLTNRLAKDFPSFYGALLTNMLTQIASFHVTGLAPDGVTPEEISWELNLSAQSTQHPTSTWPQSIVHGIPPGSSMATLLPVCVPRVDAFKKSLFRHVPAVAFRTDRRLLRLFVLMDLVEETMRTLHTETWSTKTTCVDGTTIQMNVQGGNTSTAQQATLASSTDEWTAAKKAIAAMPTDQRTPMTLLTGFLGSGKTTVLNHLLSSATPDVKLGVIVNEYGEIDIDGKIVNRTEQQQHAKQKDNNSNSSSTKDTNDIIKMSNGCICCQMNGAFIDTLLRLLESGHDLNHIVVETTGVADPTAICNSLRKGAVSSMVRIDQIVTVVDSTRVLQQIETDTNEAENIAIAQIKMADTVLVSKIDLINEREQLDTIVSRLRRMQQRARIMTCSRGQVPVEYLLDVGCSFEYLREMREGESKGKETAQETGQACHDTNCQSHGHGHGHGVKEDTSTPTRSTTNEGLMSLSFQFDRRLSQAMFMQRVLPLLTANTLRAKGLLCFHETKDRCMIFHFAAQRYSLEESKWVEETGSNRTEFVVIGRQLNKEGLENAFEACLV